MSAIHTAKVEPIDIIKLLGKDWLRYICLLLPTLNKFVLLRVCKTFHLYLTLEIGKEDTPDTPPYEYNIYKEFSSMQLLIDDIIHDTQHSKLSNSVTDIVKDDIMKDDSKQDKKKQKANKNKNKNNKRKKKNKPAKKQSVESDQFEFEALEFKERGLNQEEEFLWNELCKTEAMVKYIDHESMYEGRMNISHKMNKTIKQLNNMNKTMNSTYNILNANGEYNYILWIFASPVGEERQSLDLETRKLIQKADEECFYKYIINNNLYIENVGKINLYNKRLNKRTFFELSAIAYFLRYQNKLIEIYSGNNSNIYNNNEHEYYYNDSEQKDDFYLIISNLLILDVSKNDMSNSTAEINKIKWICPIIKSEFNNLISLQLTQCNLTDDDLHMLCLAWKQKKIHAALQILSLAENALISDAYMDELFEVLANFLGNVMCLMLYDLPLLTDETCLTVLNFYKSQFSKNQIKTDNITKEINKTYENIDLFKKELNKIKKRDKIEWKHKNENIQNFMYNIANDYGLIHKYYPETTDNNPNDEKWEKLYGEILSANNFVVSNESIIELYERNIQMSELMKENELLSKPYIKKRSKLKQLRLHLNPGIKRTGFSTLNDIFRKGYIHKKDMESVILIDGFVDDNLDKIQKYKQYLQTNVENQKEFNNLAITIKEIDNEIKVINKKLSNSNTIKLTTKRKELTKEKEILINRRFELNDLINEAKENPMTDPKRDPKWDKRLMTNWSNVWNKWIDLMAYRNFI